MTRKRFATVAATAVACVPGAAHAAELDAQMVEQRVTVPPASAGGAGSLDATVECPPGHLLAGPSHRLSSPGLDVVLSRSSPRRHRVSVRNSDAEPRELRVGATCLRRAISVRGQRYRLRNPLAASERVVMDPNAPASPGRGLVRLGCAGSSMPVFGGYDLGAGVDLLALVPRIGFGREVLFRLRNDSGAFAEPEVRAVCFQPRLRAADRSAPDARLELVYTEFTKWLERGQVNELRAECPAGYRALGGGFGSADDPGEVLVDAVNAKGYTGAFLNLHSQNGGVHAICARVSVG